MFLVVELNQDEMGRGNSRPIHKIEGLTKLKLWLLSYRGDISRLEVYKAEKLTIGLEIIE